MHPYQILTRNERRATLVVACVTGLGTLTVSVLLFVADGRTPWFDTGSELASVAQRCDAATTSGLRHACLRKVAQVARRSDAVPSKLAQLGPAYPAESVAGPRAEQ